MNENASPTPETKTETPKPLTRLDLLRRKIEQNRANHVSEIFEIYDKIPQLLAEFKTEGIAEDAMVHRLGLLIERVFIDYEVNQVPLIFETIKEKNKNKSADEAVQSLIIDPTKIDPSSFAVPQINTGESRIIMP